MGLVVVDGEKSGGSENAGETHTDGFGRVGVAKDALAGNLSEQRAESEGETQHEVGT